METNNQLNNTQQPVEPKKNWFLNHKVLWSVVGVLLLVVVAGSVALYKVQKEAQKNWENFGQNDVSGKSVQQLAKEAGWKTYTAAKYGFEIQYPPTWKVEETYTKNGLNLISPELSTALDELEKAGEGDVPPNDIGIYVLDNPKKLSVENFAKAYQDGWFTNYDKISDETVSSAQAKRYNDEDSKVPHNPLIATFVAHNDKIILIQLHGNPDYVGDYNLLVWNFKFIETANTSDWKTYTNNQYGIELKYPSHWETPAKVTAGNPEFERNNIFSVQDPNRAPSDVGGSLDPVFMVRVYNNTSEIPPIAKYLQALPEEIKNTNKQVVVDGQTIKEVNYESFAAEGAYDITYQIQLNKSGKIYILQFSYTLAGCSQIPVDLRPQCENENTALTTRANQVWGDIISSVKFTK